MNIFLKNIIKIARRWTFFSWGIGTVIAVVINLYFGFFDPIFFLIRMPISFFIIFLLWFVFFYFYYKMLILINLRGWYKDEE